MVDSLVALAQKWRFFHKQIVRRIASGGEKIECPTLSSFAAQYATGVDLAAAAAADKRLQL